MALLLAPSLQAPMAWEEGELTTAREQALLAELEELESELPEGAKLPEEPSSMTERQIVGLLQELEQEGQPTDASPGQVRIFGDGLCREATPL